MTDAQTLAVRLGGRWHGRYGTAPCPICQPERRRDQDALSLADGPAGLLAHCKKAGCGFRDILAAAGICPGSYRAPDPAVMAQREAERRADAAARQRQAGALWRNAQPIGGTLAERLTDTPTVGIARARAGPLQISCISDCLGLRRGVGDD